MDDPIFYGNVPQEYSVENEVKLNSKITNHNKNKEDLATKLKLCIRKNKVDLANICAIELLTSGGYTILWDTLYEILIENFMVLLVPKLLDIILDEYQLTNNIKTKQVHSQKDLHNNQEIRNHIAYVVTLLCLCPKNYYDIKCKTNLETEWKNIKEADLIELDANAKKYMTKYTAKRSYDKVILTDISKFLYCIKNKPITCIQNISTMIQRDIQIPTKIKDNIFLKHIPKSMEKDLSWILWFIIDDMKQKEVKATDEHLTNLNNLIRGLQTLYIIMYRRKKYTYATLTIITAIMAIKYHENIIWDAQVPVQSPIMLKLIATINILYKNIYKDKKFLKNAFTEIDKLT